ncbi:MAG: hypothetical protein PHC37_05455 [Candidatus Omnitrophica bacterium]|nr:hypothetical protein [Candidatus Omnitrophota bacterium]
MMLFDTFFSLGSLKIYIPIFVSLVIYARFLAYRKINDDLFYAFLGILFSLFVLFIFPAPAWYIWMAPFMSIFFIQYYSKYPPIIYLYFTLCLFYLVYFLFFHVSEYTPVILLNMSLPVRIDNEFARNILYTSLEMVLFAVLYSLYKFGVKSNSVYKKIHNFIIGIGGDSSAGKSTLLSDIKLILQDRALELEGDADHKWERSDENWQTITHLNPKANFLHRQAADLTALKYGRNVFRKDYDHGKGCFKSSNNIVPNEFIILSGLHTFYLPKTRKIIDLKIYLDTDERLRRHWKILRDARERGYSIGKINEQIEKRISDAKKFIEPQKGFADLIVSYEAKENFSVGDSFCAPSLKLKVTLDSSIHIESLIEKLMEENIEVLWDYVDDLNRQYILISNPPSKEVTAEIARDIIPNINEIINDGAIWQEGFRGFLQLVVLLVISEEMRAEGVSYET